jgi:hypothetical protein
MTFIVPPVSYLPNACLAYYIIPQETFPDKPDFKLIFFRHHPYAFFLEKQIEAPPFLHQLSIAYRLSQFPIRLSSFLAVNRQLSTVNPCLFSCSRQAHDLILW